MIPSSLRAGLAYSWTENVSVPAGHRLELILFSQRAVYTLVGAEGSQVLALSASETADWLPDGYKYSLRLVETGVGATPVREGYLRITANVERETQLDERSHARRVLDAIEAVLENRASSDEQELSVNGRTIKLTPLADLVRLRALYKREVQAEEESARISGGKESRRIMRVRFRNV